MQIVRVVVAAANAEERSALRLALRQEPDLDVVAEVADSRGLLAYIQAGRPDLILLDWELPGHPAMDLLDGLRSGDSRPCVIVMSLRPQAEEVASSAGADGFVYKAFPPHEMLAQIRRWTSARVEGANPQDDRPGE